MFNLKYCLFQNMGIVQTENLKEFIPNVKKQWSAFTFQNKLWKAETRRMILVAHQNEKLKKMVTGGEIMEAIL